MKKYKLAACGGTFDLFHFGHKEFLESIFKASEKIIIGITSDKFSFDKSAYENFNTRKKSVEKFIKTNQINAQILKIDDIYGPTLSEKYPFDALFVTNDSESGADKINAKRKGLGLPLLKIIKVPLYKTSDGKTLSSTRIKNGQISRDGKKYIDEDLNFTLPENLRASFSKPFGQLVKKIEGSFSKNIVAVGDETVKSFTSKKIQPALSIIDLKNNRKSKYKGASDLGLNPQKIIKAVNSSGHITKDLIGAVKLGLETHRSVVLVDGEEDLAVIPAVLLSPLGYKIYYGQPGKGVVKIVVSENVKRQIKELLSQFLRKVL